MSVWYREGTVALTNNSPTVIGTGTYWTTVGIDPGDMFQVGGEMYEIGSIESDTEITLVGDYTGVTTASAIYAIIPNYAVRPYSTVVGRQMLLLDKWVRREQELIEWQTAPASADINNPTTVSMTAWNGLQQDVISLPQALAIALEGGVSSWNDLEDIPSWLTTGSLSDWSAIAPTSKQNASANLSAWAGVTVTAKQDASANLNGWSAIAPASKLSVTGGEMEASITFTNGSDDWMIQGDMGGVYSDVDGVSLISGAGRFKVTPTALTFKTQDVWWAGNFTPTSIPTQTANLTIKNAFASLFLQDAEGAQKSRLGYNGTDIYLSSETGRFFIRPVGYSTTAGQLEISATDIKWSGKSLLRADSDLSGLPFVAKAGDTMTGALNFSVANHSWLVNRTDVGGIWTTAAGTGLVSVINGGWTMLEALEAKVVSNKPFWISAITADFIAETTGDDAYFTPGKALGGYHGRAAGATVGTMHYRAVEQWTSTSRPTSLDIRLVRTNATGVSTALQITNERLLANFSAGATAAAGEGRMYLQSNVAGGVSNVSVLPGVGGSHAILSVFTSSDTANSAMMQFGYSQAGGAVISTTKTGTGVASGITFSPNDVPVLQVHTNSEVNVLSPNADASANRMFAVIRGENVIWMNAKGSAGSWNPAIRANESTILFSQATNNSNSLFIGGWNSHRIGVRVYSNTTTDGSAFGIEGGNLGSQFGHIALLQSGKRIWGIGMETDRAWKLWQYSDAGAYQSNPMTVARDSSTQRITFEGGVFSMGAAGTFKLGERDDSSKHWDLYAASGTYYLWNNRINTNAFSVTSDGNTSCRGNASIGNQLYVTAWVRSQNSGSGWYHDVHGGGIYMIDNTWIRTYGSRGFLISNNELRIESTSPNIVCYDTDNGTTHWIHCNDGNHGFLRNNSFSWGAYRDGNNNWVCSGNIVAYASDVRLKKNFKPIADPLGKLAKIDGYLFDWDEDACKRADFEPRLWTEHGLAAQQIQKIMPDIVVPSPANKNYLTVMYERLTPFLIAVDKAQQRLIEDQAQRIIDLEERLARIEKALGV